MIKQLTLTAWFFLVINPHYQSGTVTVAGPFQSAAQCREIKANFPEGWGSTFKVTNCWEYKRPGEED